MIPSQQCCVLLSCGNPGRLSHNTQQQAHNSFKHIPRTCYHPDADGFTKRKAATTYQLIFDTTIPSVHQHLATQPITKSNKHKADGSNIGSSERVLGAVLRWQDCTEMSSSQITQTCAANAHQQGNTTPRRQRRMVSFKPCSCILPMSTCTDASRIQPMPSRTKAMQHIEQLSHGN